MRTAGRLAHHRELLRDEGGRHPELPVVGRQVDGSGAGAGRGQMEDDGADGQGVAEADGQADGQAPGWELARMGEEEREGSLGKPRCGVFGGGSIRLTEDRWGSVAGLVAGRELLRPSVQRSAVGEGANPKGGAEAVSHRFWRGRGPGGRRSRSGP